MATINISLPDAMKEFVDEETSRGGYASVSEYFRTLLRDAQERKHQQEVEARLLEGLASDTVEWTPERREALRSRVERAIAAKRR